MNSQKKFPAKCAIFDLFHTLVNPEEHKPKEFTKTKKIAEIFSMDSSEFAKYWDETSVTRNTNRSRKPIDLVEDYVVRSTGHSPSMGDLLVVDTILGRYHDMALANPRSDVIVALHNLRFKGIRLGVLANADEREVSTWFRSPRSGLFDAACFSCDIGVEKPSREAYSAAANKMGVPPSGIVYVGDGLEGDLEGAKEAGFAGIVFMEGIISRHGLLSSQEIKKQESLADATIQRISELEQFL